MLHNAVGENNVKFNSAYGASVPKSLGTRSDIKCISLLNQDKLQNVELVHMR